MNKVAFALITALCVQAAIPQLSAQIPRQLEGPARAATTPVSPVAQRVIQTMSFGGILEGTS